MTETKEEEQIDFAESKTKVDSNEDFDWLNNKNMDSQTRKKIKTDENKKARMVVRIAKKFKRAGMEPDLYDISGTVDSSLTFSENMNLCTKQFGYKDPIITRRKIKDEEDSFKLRQIDMYGKVTIDYLDAIKKEDEKEKYRDLYTTIHSLNTKDSYDRYKEESGQSPLKVTNVFCVEIVEKLIKMISVEAEIRFKCEEVDKLEPFGQIGYLQWAIVDYGITMFKRLVDKNEIPELYLFNKDLVITFDDKHIKRVMPRFSNVRQGMLNGSGEESFVLRVTNEHKKEIRDLCESYRVKESDLLYYFTIFALDSYYYNSERVKVFAASHFYTEGEMVNDLRKHIEGYAYDTKKYLGNLLPYLEDEHKMKLCLVEHGFVSKRNTDAMDIFLNRIKAIKNYIEEPKLENF